MEGIGFIHEKLDIKILILYILNHLPAAWMRRRCPISFSATTASAILTTLTVLRNWWIRRTSRKRAASTHHGKGSRNVNEVASSLPYSVRMKADRVTEPIAEQMRRAA